MMSFSKLFESPEWKLHLQMLRPSQIPADPQAKEESKTDFSVLYFPSDEALDEEEILSRFQEYLSHDVIHPREVTEPAPARVLREFLNSLGAIDEPIWRTLPLSQLFRVSTGEIPISRKLSEQLSKTFGTPSEFWVEIQKEYDRRWAQATQRTE